MGILDKLSDMRKRVDEDWRDDARAAKSAKWVKDFHRDRLDKLNFSIDTSFGEFKLNIHPNWKGGPEIRVYLGDDYLFYEIFENVKELKDFIENKLTDEIYKHVREKFYYKIQKMPRDEARSILKRFDGLLEELDKGIELEIDFDKLEKDLHRYGVYSRALNDRSSNKSNLETRARRNFEKEHASLPKLRKTENPRSTGSTNSNRRMVEDKVLQLTDINSISTATRSMQLSTIQTIRSTIRSLTSKST